MKTTTCVPTLLLSLCLVPFAHAAIGDQLLKLTANDGAVSDEFGVSVAISGETALVGAQYDDDNGSRSGSAYLFDVGTGAQLFKLTPDDGAAHDQFGLSVAISGDTALVGSWADDDNGIDSGSAYLFDVNTGAQLFKLTPDDGAADDRFGWSVAISGDTALVGANADDDNGSFSGSAYLFDVTTGTQLAKLTPNDGAAWVEFGRSVAISGDTALVGAYGDRSAYLFDVASGAQLAKLTPNEVSVDSFGVSVAISGHTALVGAWQDDDNGRVSGAAYLFDVATGDQLAKLTPNDGAAADYFGGFVAIAADTALVGAYGDDDNGNESGSAYLFDVASGTQLAKLTPNDGARGHFFGWSVAISGDTALVGARFDDDNGPNSGSAYLFDATVVPEPSAILLAALATAGLLFWRRW